MLHKIIGKRILKFNAKPPSPLLPPSITKNNRKIQKLEEIKVPPMNEGCNAMLDGLNMNRDFILKKAFNIKSNKSEINAFYTTEISPQLGAIKNWTDMCIPKKKNKSCMYAKEAISFMSELPSNILESKNGINTADIMFSLISNQLDQCKP